MYAFEIYTKTSDEIVIRLENLNHELMQLLINDNSTIQELINTKWYEYIKYCHFQLQEYTFVVIKQTKKNVILVRIK